MGNNFASSGGQAAGRDIRNLSIHIASPKPESQLQAEFARRTGIWCSKPAREWLEDLMENHRFTVKELAVAWKAGSLGWHTQKDAQKIVTPWIEAVFAYGIVFMMSIYFLALALPVIGNSQHDAKSAIAIFGGGFMFLGVCWMANRFMLWPRRIALRIRRISNDPSWQTTQGAANERS